MAEEPIEFLDDYMHDLIGKYNNTSISWYLMAGYSKYVKNKPLLTKKAHKFLCSFINDKWDTLNNIHKKYVNRKNLNDLGEYADFINIPSITKSAADGHINKMYSNKTKSNPFAKTNSATKKKQEEYNGLTGTPRLRMESIVSLSGVGTQDIPTLTPAAERYGFKHRFTNDCLEYLGISSCKANISARTLKFIYDLIEIKEVLVNMQIEKYVISEVLIDSKNKDVWNLL